MKKILQHLFEYKTLTRDKASSLLIQLSQGQFNEQEITAFITVFLMRSITIPELEGFRDALLELSTPVNFDGTPVIDIVGTGGDGKNTFNISTLACFIVAGAGVKVAKHGNYGASSISGSSNVMEQLGYKFSNNNEKLKLELEQTGVCFLHAPLFHPALKAVGGIRKNLGFRTFFNILGPLVNPANPDYQLVGVYNVELARIYNYIFQQTTKSFTIIHSLDGYDEISLTNDAKVITKAGEKILTPEIMGKRTVQPQDLYGGNTVEEAAKLFQKILKCEGSWAQNAVVLANAAMALHGSGTYESYAEAYAAAVESFESKAALRSMQQLIALQ